MTILEKLAANQLPSGQFQTEVHNLEENTSRKVHTIAPTYLISLILSTLKEQGKSSRCLEQILNNDLNFLESSAYHDPITHIKVWHFNAFYPPDWEETLWSSLLLYRAGRISKHELASLEKLLRTNDTEENGVGVWIKDDYSKNNKENNVFDPVVSLAVTTWLDEIFRSDSPATENYIKRSHHSDTPSLYYAEDFRKFFFWLAGRGEKPVTLNHINYRLFHHGKRTNVWYASQDVWDAASLLLQF